MVGNVLGVPEGGVWDLLTDTRVGGADKGLGVAVSRGEEGSIGTMSEPWGNGEGDGERGEARDAGEPETSEETESYALRGDIIVVLNREDRIQNRNLLFLGYV